MKIFSIWMLVFISGLLHAQSELLSPKDFNNLLVDSSIQKLDVRTKVEFEMVGHIDDFYQVSISDKSFDQKILNAFDPQKPILVTCFSGHRSKDAVKKLEALGFKKIYELKGGLINWMEKGYSLE